jgi:iron complex outermembrane receptor protein
VLSGQFLYDHQPDLSRSYPGDFQGLNAQQTGTFNTIFGPMSSARPVSGPYDVPLSAHSTQATLRAGRLQVSFFENRSRVSTSPAYTPGNAVYNAAAFNQNTLLVGAGIYTQEIGRATSTSTLTLSRHELSPLSGYWNVYSNFEKSYKYAYGSSIRAEQQLSWTPATAVTLTVGGTYEHFYSIPQGADLNAPVQSRDAPGTILDTNITDDFVKLRYANTGGYAQLQYAITPAVGLTLGARADYNTRFGATFNPRAGIVAHVTPATTFKLLYGTAYLAPSPYQEYGHYGSFYSTDGGATFASDYWHLPNPNLKPQLKQTVEANVVHEIGSTVSVSASAFTSHLTNLVQLADPDQSYAGTYHGWPVAYIDFAVNEGHETTYGGTASLEFLKAFGAEQRVAGHAELSIVDGRVWNDVSTGARLQLGGMSPVQGRFGADVDWGKWTAAPRLAVVSAQRVLATTTPDGGVRRTLPGYATVDVNIRRRHVLGHLDAFLTIENLLDKRYRNINTRAYTNPEELVGAPQNPRRFTIGFDLRFR